MKLIRFRRGGRTHWEIAFNEQHLAAKLNGEIAEVVMPAKPWYVRFYRLFRPLQGVDVPADGIMREVKL